MYIIYIQQVINNSSWYFSCCILKKVIDIQYFKSNEPPHLFSHEHSSRQQKWCKREQGQAYLNHAERSPFSRSKSNEFSFMMVSFF